jgi:hypothetical protein
MRSAADLNTWSQSYDIVAGQITLGVLRMDYQVTPYTDLRNLRRRRGYLITAKMRIALGQTVKASELAPQNITAYNDYPALILSEIGVSGYDTQSSTDFYLLDYSPKTLNSSISTTADSSHDASATTSSDVTMGSSESETNSYEYSMPSGSTKTDTTFNSDSTGKSSTAGGSAGSSDSMSIKEWASYAVIDANNQEPSWVWAQDFPWPIVDLHSVDPSSVENVLLPKHIVARLYSPPQLDSNNKVVAPAVVYPPSKLALYGVNFVAKTTWIYSIGSNVVPTDSLTISPKLTFWVASHGIGVGGADESHFGATLALKGVYQDNPTTTFAITLDLTSLALEPIPYNGADNGAIVGFVRQQYITTPDNTNGFGIVSTANNLLICGLGFQTPAGDDQPMTATIGPQSSPTNPAATMTISFKIVDDDASYTLFMKHWKTTPRSCVLSIVVNGNPAIVRHVDTDEAAGGSDNIMRVMLRSKDFASAEFFDYLQMGLNTVVIGIAGSGDTPDPDQAAGYAIRAVSIG